jgi:hypothetical protein
MSTDANPTVRGRHEADGLASTVSRALDALDRAVNETPAEVQTGEIGHITFIGESVAREIGRASCRERV